MDTFQDEMRHDEASFLMGIVKIYFYFLYFLASSLRKIQYTKESTTMLFSKSINDRSKEAQHCCCLCLKCSDQQITKAGYQLPFPFSQSFFSLLQVAAACFVDEWAFVKFLILHQLTTSPSLAKSYTFINSCTREHSAKTQYQKFETNNPRKGFARPESQFLHSCFCERFIYSPDQSAYSAEGKYVDQTWEYIDRSQTHEC